MSGDDLLKIPENGIRLVSVSYYDLRIVDIILDNNRNRNLLRHLYCSLAENRY